MERSSSRLKVFAVLVALMFIALSTRLWFLQVLATEQFQDEAKDNSVRTASTDALRGEIITADQADKEDPKALVTNRKSLEVRINKQTLDESGRGDEVLLRLSDMLHIDVKDLRAALDDPRYYDFQPKPVAEFVDEKVRFYIEEHHDDFPGVDVVDASVRSYPYGQMAAHIVGSVGQISRDQVDDPAYKGYGLNDLVGKSGLEVTYEKWLRGRAGVQHYVVNSDGETIRRLGGVDPTPGDNLVLSLNAKIQRAAEDALDEGIQHARTMFDEDTNKYFEANAGAVVVLDPKTGGVVAMASSPTYDPRWFVKGLKPGESCYLGLVKQCAGADSVAPLLDRAYQEVYLPGSTFKPFTALASVKEGHASLGGSYDCPAEYVHPGDTTDTVFHNWSSVGLSYMPLTDLLRISCDTAFYKWGSDFYYDWSNDPFGPNNEPLQRDLRQWGFQSPTGIDLPGEAAGLIPDAAWGDDPAQMGTPKDPGILPYGWTPGGDILLMIGSGYVTVTPLQLATAYAALANDGHLCRPHIVDHIVDARGTVVKKVGGQCDRTLPYTKEQLSYIMNALTQVPVSGTATTAFAGFPLSEYPVAGKTGTAFRGSPFQDTSWFAGMVPANDPQYVVVAMVEQAGFGSDVAAPIVRRVIESIYGIQSTAPVVAQAGQD
jgi:penicillin-binding protein 2